MLVVMAKAASIEQQLSALGTLRADPKSDLARPELKKALASKTNLVVAKAATLVTESNQADFLPDLVLAFDRFFAAGSDKGCGAKTAIASGLYALGHNDPAAFLRGIHHVQKEASFGPSVDAAAELRGICALGLARIGYADVLMELAELLVDPEVQPRIMAVRAVAYTGSEAGVPLLRMKALAGDADNEVTAECFTALMKLSPRKSLPFVARFLKSQEVELVEAAGLAIGGSRLAEAFELLRGEWESHLAPEPRRPLLLGIAMSRLPAAVEFLLERVADDRPAPAVDAINAMTLYKHDQAIMQRLRKIVDDRGEPELRAAMQKFE
jgi:HEAT repeat protein